MDLLLNDKSISVNASRSEVNKVIEQFVKTFFRINDSVKVINLFTTIKLNEIFFTKDYGIPVWRNTRVDPDLYRGFLSMREHEIIKSEINDDEKEVSYNGQINGALLMAIELDCPLISFDTDLIWENPNIKVTVDYIDDRPTEFELITNFYSTEIKPDLLPKENLLVQYPKPALLIQDLNVVFPNLIFNDCAIKQLREFPFMRAYASLLNRLEALEKYFATWDGNEFKKEAFPNRTISNESPETINRYKKEYTFVFNGKNVLVQKHIRYTGDIQGRIYFSPDYESKKGLICSLTTKLPTIEAPHI